MIIIENEQDKVILDKKIERLIEKTIELCMKSEKLEKDYEISVLIVDDEEIRDINKEHRNIDKSTDVLSFPMVDFKDGKLISDEGDYDLEMGELILGDIIISAETAMTTGGSYGHSLKERWLFLLPIPVFTF